MFKSSSCPVTQNTLARDYSLLSLRAGALACSNASSAILASCTATPVLSKITSPRGRTRGPSSHAPNSTTASLWIRPEKGCTPAHQWQSEAIRGNQRQSEAIRGTQRHSEALSGTQWHSVALRGTQWHSEALSGTQRHSEAIVPARIACCSSPSVIISRHLLRSVFISPHQSS
jgi:hypothetical protein